MKERAARRARTLDEVRAQLARRCTSQRRRLRRLDAARRRQLGGEEVLRRAACSRLALAARRPRSAADARAQGDGDVVRRPERLTAGVSDQLLGQLAPDGKTLYFVSNRNTTNEIYRQDACRPGAKLALRRGRRRHLAAPQPRRQAPLLHLVSRRRRGQLCVRDLPDKHRRCLAGDRQRAAGASGSTTRASRSSAAARSRATCALREVEVARKLASAQPLVERNLTEPDRVARRALAGLRAASTRYVERVGPAFAARAARAARGAAARSSRRSADAAADRSAGPDRPARLLRRRAAGSTSPSSSTTPTRTARSTPATTACSSACRSSPARDDAPARAAAACPQQLTDAVVELPVSVAGGDSCWSPPARAPNSLDVYSLPLDGQVPARVERRAAGRWRSTWPPAPSSSCCSTAACSSARPT